MQSLLSLSLSIYFICYAFEGLVRYGLNMVGADELIFLRDIFLAIPIVAIFVTQLSQNRLHPAYIVFLFIVGFHGAVMYANMGSVFAVIYSAKMLMSMLAGAVARPQVLRPGRLGLALFAFLWAMTAAGVIAEKFFVDFPWVGMQAKIADFQVGISQDWQLEGIDKRAGGFMRSSINVAILEPLLSLILLFNVRAWFTRVLVAALTLFVLYCTTQKGAIIAYGLVLILLLAAYKRPAPVLCGAFFAALAAAIILPLTLPGYLMPDAKGMFSFSSFYLRVEDMWPRAWQWIGEHEAFPFGVGLGGISGAQRFYAPSEIDDADNIFILLYAFFGVMSFLYMGWLSYYVFKRRQDNSPVNIHALATLVFLFAYGCVISIVEDQMGGLFLGAAAAWLGYEAEKHAVRKPTPAVSGLVEAS